MSDLINSSDPVLATSNEKQPSGNENMDDASTSAQNPSALVPQLAEHGITNQDLAVAIKVLNAISTLNPKNRNKNDKKRKAPESENAVGEAASKDNPNEYLNDGLAKYRQPNLRAFRKCLSTCISLHQLLMYDGKTEEEYFAQRMQERTLKRQKMAEKAMQKKYVASTDLRKGRVEKLEKLKHDRREEEEEKMRMLEYLIPDGHVNTGDVVQPKLLENGSDCDPKRGNVCGSDEASNFKNSAQKYEQDPTILPKLRSCYVCKIRFRILHKFYDQLCPSCASLNYEKRHQTADMSDCVSVVTGSRVKIGFQVCLKLLRAGATVVATTRFPNNAVEAFRKEKDFGVWKDRLHVYGLDLRDVTGLEAFTRYLKLRFGEKGIDVLINNACQTVRRPGGYYLPLVEKEAKLWSDADEDHREILKGCVDFERIRRRLVNNHTESEGGSVKFLSDSTKQEANRLLANDTKAALEAVDQIDVNDRKGTNTLSHDHITRPCSLAKRDVIFETTGISHSAAMSQMAIIPEDVGVDENVMPSGLSDINGHQLDLRSTNSWLLKMHDVSTPEIMECMFVNAIAPFVLNSRLKPLMETPAGDPKRPDRYIINVSAMEGKFYRYKMPNHPHTNMAKAALNMLTRTSSEDLAKKSRIFMNSVDTGWINDENPLEKASKIAKTNLFQTPIDEIDAAARILDPVIVGMNLDKEMNYQDKGTVKDYGKFFKDYKETEW